MFVILLFIYADLIKLSFFTALQELLVKNNGLSKFKIEVLVSKICLIVLEILIMGYN